MDWHYFVLVLKGVFCDIRSVPAYVGLATLLLRAFPQWEGGKMKWVVQKIREHPALVCMSFVMVSVILVSHDLYVNKSVPPQPSFATPDALIPAVLQDLNVQLADLTRADFVIRNKVFVNCHIYGPAIVLPKGQCVLDIRLEGSPDISFIETSSKTAYGATVLQDCKIIGCTLHKISFIGSAKQIAEWKAKAASVRK